MKPLLRMAISVGSILSVHGWFTQYARADVAKPCRVADTEDERALAAATMQATISLDGFIAELKARAAELEAALAQPDAGPEIVEAYRQTRSHLDTAKAQLVEFARLAAVWCDDQHR